MLRSCAARCLRRSTLAPARRELCGGDFGLKNAFVTMQLHPGATTKQIKAKFYELAKATHPYGLTRLKPLDRSRRQSTTADRMR